MNKLSNYVQLIGFLGKDPEVSQMPSGKTVVNFSMATNESYKNTQGEKVIETQWHRVVAFGKVAELVQKYFKKGHKYAIAGKLTHNTYEDREGIKRNSTQVVMNTFEFMQNNQTAPSANQIDDEPF